jgi:hypothetical protein
MPMDSQSSRFSEKVEAVTNTLFASEDADE